VVAFSTWTFVLFAYLYPIYIFFYFVSLCITQKTIFYCVYMLFFFTGVHRKVACLTLGMQLQVSPSTATDLYFVGEEWERGGVVACLSLGMQLQMSPSTTTVCLHKRLQLTFVLSVGGMRGGSFMPQTRHATASVVLDCKCMSTHPIATNIFAMSEDIGRGPQLHV
jgi:hypothetical protein